MSELKTLKEIDFDGLKIKADVRDKTTGKESEEEFVSIRKLRQEAIIWIENFAKEQGYKSALEILQSLTDKSDNMAFHKIDAFMEFFNIPEEELKQEVEDE